MRFAVKLASNLGFPGRAILPESSSPVVSAGVFASEPTVTRPTTGTFNLRPAFDLDVNPRPEIDLVTGRRPGGAGANLGSPSVGPDPGTGVGVETVPYEFKRLDNADRPVLVRADAEGGAWALVSFDTDTIAYSPTQALYFSLIKLTFSPVPAAEAPTAAAAVTFLSTDGPARLLVSLEVINQTAAPLVYPLPTGTKLKLVVRDGSARRIYSAVTPVANVNEVNLLPGEWFSFHAEWDSSGGALAAAQTYSATVRLTGTDLRGEAAFTVAPDEE